MKASYRLSVGRAILEGPHAGLDLERSLERFVDLLRAALVRELGEGVVEVALDREGAATSLVRLAAGRDLEVRIRGVVRAVRHTGEWAVHAEMVGPGES